MFENHSNNNNSNKTKEIIQSCRQDRVLEMKCVLFFPFWNSDSVSLGREKRRVQFLDLLTNFV